MDYITEKCKNKKLWAKSYLKSQFCGDISTTSRIESFHAKIKDHLTSSSNLQMVFNAFEDIMKINVAKFKNEYLRHGKVTEMK